MKAIVATLRIKPGSNADFEVAARALVAAVNANEPDCHFYQLFRGEDPETYYMLEHYKDDAAIEFHRSTAHFKELGAKMGPHMAGRPDVQILDQVSS